MRRTSAWVAIVLLGVTLAAGAWRLHRRLAVRANVDSPRAFYVAERGHAIRFPASGAREIHVVSHLVVDGEAPARYHLAVAFVDAAGAALERRELTLDVAHARAPSARGEAAMTPARLVRLVPPAGAATVELTSVDGRALLRLSRPSEKRTSRERALRRAGVDPAWLAPTSAAELHADRLVTLPALDEVPTLSLPSATPTPSEAALPPAPSARAGEPVGPNRAVVWNLDGPGTARVRLTGRGQLDVEIRSPSRSAHYALAADTVEPLALDVAAEPTTLSVRPLDGARGAVSLEVSGAHALGGGILARAARREWGWTADAPLRYAVVDARPLRVTCRARPLSDGARCDWRLSDPRGRVLAHGVLVGAREIDPFTSVDVEGDERDLGTPRTLHVVPPRGATTLELRASSALVQAFALMEDGSDDRPAAPYDAPVAPLVWSDVPVRAPRWVALRPQPGLEARPQELAIEVTPRLVARPLPATAAVRSLFPAQASLRREIVEASRHAPGAITLLAAGVPSELMVASSGVQARRVEARCELSGELGGELALRVDGQIAARAPASTGALRLVAAASPGRHRVELVGNGDARCTVLAAQVGARQVRRAVFPASRDGLRLTVSKPAGVFPVHVAVYSARADGELALDIDGGRLQRRGDVVERVTRSTRRWTWASASGPEALLLPGRQRITRVLVGSVILGDDLPAGTHTLALRAREPGVWARFWAPGRKAHVERVESYMTTEEQP